MYVMYLFVICLCIKYLNCNTKANQTLLRTAKLISKLSIIASFSFVSTICIVMVLANYLLSACISIDNCINVICVLLCFNFNQKYYDQCCCLCKVSCLTVCSYILRLNVKRINKQQREIVAVKDNILV